WFDNTSNVTAPFRQQQKTGSLPTDPWDGSQSQQPVAFRVEGSPALSTCPLETGPVIGTANFWTAPDAFTDVYWRIPRASCTACSQPQGLVIKTISFRLHAFSACTANVRLSVVGAANVGGCETPDTTHVLCSPVTRAVAASGPGSTTYSVAPVAGCCV